MARIRSDKPESYQSETLAEISLAAERTFRGMATIADDRGRLADKPAQINGELWSMRSERAPHTRDDLEAELAEMVKVDLVCRYVGCDGKRYVHLVKWDAHQKIDRPSKSRLPRCPFHQVKDDYCGLHEGECAFHEDSRQSREDSMQTREPSHGSGESSMLDLGSRTVDRGPRTVKQPPRASAREAPPPRGTPLANQMLDEHVAACAAPPSRPTRTKVGDMIDTLLDDPNVKPDEIREGLTKLRARPDLGPGTLPALVDEIRQKRANPELASRASPRRDYSRGGAADPLTDQHYGEGATEI